METSYYPFPKRQILDSSKLKEFADDNFKFDENGRKFFKSVENSVGKGEIARYEEFLLFPQCFQRLVLQPRKNRLVWERFTGIIHCNSSSILSFQLKASMSKDSMSGGRITNRAGRERPRFIRPVERQRMRPWLVEHLDKNDIPGLTWVDRKEKVFRIAWKHAANQCFNLQKDTNLFERWAIHTGKLYSQCLSCEMRAKELFRTK